MNRQAFTQLNITDKIKYFNEKLKLGETVIRIREDLGISEKTWQKEVKTNGYKYDTKLKNYIKVTEVVDSYKSNQTVVNTLSYENNQNVVNEVGYKSNQNVVVTENEYNRVINELQEIKTMYSKFEDMYSWYELQKNVVEKEQLKVESNNNELVTRSFKIYSDIYKDFMEFCNNHKEYKVQDIVSQACKELVEKYK